MTTDKLKNILTIESIGDGSTGQMLKALYNNDKFERYRINHFFINDLNDGNLDDRLLFEGLNRKILEFQPEVILIHAGQYFWKNVEYFLRVIPKIKVEHPEIKFGIQGRERMSRHIVSILDSSSELIGLEKLFFGFNR